jgi:predicted ATPase
LAEQLLTLAQRTQDPALFLQAHSALGVTSFFLGEFALAREQVEQGIALYNPQKHHPYVSGVVLDLGIMCLIYAAWILWLLGYPDQALKRIQHALILSQELSHPHSTAFTLNYAADLHRLRREVKAVQEWAEAAVALSSEHELTLLLARATILQGWALAEQGQGMEGCARIRQSLADYQATGAELGRAYFLAPLAEAYGKTGQIEEGLTTLTEALAVADKTGERFYEAELYRLKGELTLAQSSVQRLESSVTNPQPPIPNLQTEAEACFLKAIDIARQQQAKSLELRAATSLARLRQQQGKKAEARQMLAEIYGWFTEGFETADLKEARALLEELQR